SFPDPSRQAAWQLQAALKDANVTIALPAASIRQFPGRKMGPRQVLDRLASPTVAAIAQRTNFKSVNLYAETLLREINKSRGREEHELGDATLVLEHLEQLDIDITGVQLLDGSGLGTRNFFPPAFMTAFLRAKQNDEIFRNTIPVAGRSGSMRHRLKGTSAVGRLYSKSGSLNSARGYAGYAFPADGRKLAFCIMINNYTATAKKVNRLLLDFQLLLCQSK
ncbi:MAG: D-alanyl-D-alanine carboxypeptidase, partial [Bacteroidota bacterium]